MEVLGTCLSLTEDLEMKRCGCLISDTGGKEISLRELAEMYQCTLPSFAFSYAEQKKKKQKKRKLDEYPNVNFSDCVLNSL